MTKLDYADIHDRATVDECRRIVTLFEEKMNEDGMDRSDPDAQERRRAVWVAHRIMLYVKMGERVESKIMHLKQIDERDRRQELLLENAVSSDRVRCLHCSELMSFSDKQIYETEGRERVTLFYKCPNICLPMRVFYDNGEEYKPVPKTCKKCAEPISESTKRNGQIITTQYKCGACGEEDVFEIDLTPKEKLFDEHFAADREKYCMNEKELDRYREGKVSMQSFSRTMKNMEEKAKDAKTNARIAKVRKLRVIELQEFLTKLLEEYAFTKIELSTPVNSDGFRLRLTFLDTQPNRPDQDAVKLIQSTLRNHLHDTNWRLSKSSVMSTLGALSCELRGYASETQLRELMVRENKANISQKDPSSEG